MDHTKKEYCQNFQNIIILNNKGINYISEYVTIPKERNKIIVTDLGKQVLEYLSTHFSMIINIQFTSDVERDLDSIANGNSNWKDIINKIYKTFNPIVTMQQNIKTIKPDKVTYLDYEIKIDLICNELSRISNDDNSTILKTIKKLAEVNKVKFLNKSHQHTFLKLFDKMRYGSL